MDSDPERFDPFDEWVPDFSEYQFDEDSNQILDENGDPYDTPVLQQCTRQAEQGIDPNHTLKKLLEDQFNRDKDQRQDGPSDPADVMPGPVYRRLDNGIFFEDSAFARTVLCSEQGVPSKDLEGYIVMPANQVGRIRSRNGNHKGNTRILFISPDILSDDLKSLFY